ncbi:MAG: tryptophan synthase subunit alpha [Kiritimatiellae bacterium]|nr:tryptophan synthase subunit alpha [Kiritimatiellia bacterium]
MKENRITRCFAKAKAENRPVFVAYLTTGYPTPARSEAEVDRLLGGGGADVIELGVPFSDPFADGAVIRAAAYRALEQGVTLADVIELAGRVRSRHPEAVIVVFSYYNVIHSMGVDRFAAAAAAAGVDAVLAVDLPLEERDELLSPLRGRGLTMVPLIAPATPADRIRKIAEGLEDSFLYAITVNGVTGARESLPPELAGRLDAIRAAVPQPVVAGFGISSRAQGEKLVAGHADGYVIGSAIVKALGGEI